MLVNGVSSQLAVVDRPGDGLPVVLLSGGPGVPDYLEPVAELIAPSRRVVTFDQRGVGSSSAPSGRYDIDSYIGDLEAIRNYVGVDKIHIFGHSWGGLYAQLYAFRYPDRVASLLLCNSSVGVGSTWRTMERSVMDYNRRAAGGPKWLRVGAWQLAAFLPGRMGDTGARKVMAQVWANYQDPQDRIAADPDWLRGVRSEAMFRTRKAILACPEDRLPNKTSNGLPFAITVLYGGKDIYGDTTHFVHDRYPSAKHVTLEKAGHLPWMQSKHEFADVLSEFFDF